MSSIKRQFGRPSGILGRLVGHFMARNNSEVNRVALEVLSPRPDATVLEVGFGPGLGILGLAESVPDGHVAGIDPSREMVRQASRRNRRAIRAGHVELRQGSVESLPWEDGRFTDALAVSCIHHLVDARASGATGEEERPALLELRRVLREGGTLLLAMRLALAEPNPWKAPGVSGSEVERLERALRALDFQDVRSSRWPAGDREVVCIHARRQP